MPGCGPRVGQAAWDAVGHQAHGGAACGGVAAGGGSTLNAVADGRFRFRGRYDKMKKYNITADEMLAKVDGYSNSEALAIVALVKSKLLLKIAFHASITITDPREENRG